MSVNIHTCVDYLLSGYHVALELLMAFVPSVLAFACSFTTGSDGETFELLLSLTASDILIQTSGKLSKYRYVFVLVPDQFYKHAAMSIKGHKHTSGTRLVKCDA